MLSQKVVSPVKTGVQSLYNYIKSLDSGLRRNDEKMNLETFCECINFIKGRISCRTDSIVSVLSCLT
jgi:hypothetical protein